MAIGSTWNWSWRHQHDSGTVRIVTKNIPSLIVDVAENVEADNYRPSNGKHRFVIV
jgi:hypothetical protein